jgi:hypothetical protein
MDFALYSDFALYVLVVCCNDAYDDDGPASLAEFLCPAACAMFLRLKSGSPS